MLKVTVIVDKDFQHMLCVLTQLVKYIQDQIFVMVVGVPRVKNLQEDLFNEYNDFFFQVNPEVKEEAVENA